MSTGYFTFGAQDLGALYGLILERRRVALIPKTRDRSVMVPGRAGSHDFGTDLGEREITLECFFNQSTRAALMTAFQGVAQALDPSTEIVTGDKAFKQLIFDDLSDRYFLAKLTGMPVPEIIVTTGKVTLTMRCSDPFAYSTAQYVVSGGQATITGFSAYRQAPEKILWNLVKNGGFVVATGAEWALHANAARVADAASPSGWALRLIATAGSQISEAVVPVEAGAAYSFAVQCHGDGTTYAYFRIQWRDVGGNNIPPSVSSSTQTAATYAEKTLTNQIAPGNARTVAIQLINDAAGIMFYTAVRMMQQAGAPAAWVTATHQQTLTQKGLAIYEAGTNSAADGDEEAVGTASYAATNATLSKDTVTFFAGAKSLKVVATANGGYASQGGALAAAQPITASVRCKPGGTTSGLKLISTPSNAVIGTHIPGAAGDWQALRVSGVIAGGDTGWQVQLIAGANTETSYFDNLAAENKAYDTMNADPSGQAFALASRTISDAKFPIPTGFDQNDFAAIVVFRPDLASSSLRTHDLLAIVASSGNYVGVMAYQSFGGTIAVMKERANITALADSAISFAAGDSVAIGMRFSTTAGLRVYVRKNGGALTQVSTATPEALLPFAGAPTSLYVGTSVPTIANGSGMADGSIGVVRILKGALTDAQIDAVLANPYQQQDETIELAVWRFEGVAAPEDFSSNTLSLEIGGTYWVDPVIELTAGGSYTGNIVFTDSLGNVFTWNGTVALNDVLKVESDTLRVRKNGTLSMSGVVAGSKWPRFRGGGLRDSIVVTGISSANIKALTATYRHRWI